MSSSVLITRLCSRWSLPHICGDVPHHLDEGLKPRGHIESQNPRAEIPLRRTGIFLFLWFYGAILNRLFVLCYKDS